MKLVKEFYSKQDITRKPPFNLKAGDEGYFGNANYTVKQSGLYTLKNASVTPLGIIYKNFRSKKDFIVCYDIDFKKYQTRYLLKTLLKYKKKTLDKHTKYLLLFDNYSGPHGFAHWLCDGLTRITELNDELNDYTVLFPAYFKNEKLYLETVQYFKITKIAYLEENTLVTVPELYAPSHIAGTGNFHPENIRKLRAIILPQVKAATRPLEYIYISRAKASRRFVNNEQEVSTYLQQQGFEIVYFEEYSFHEQLELISNAKMVISTHGAALSMVMFMNQGSKVLEFRKSIDTVNNMYYSLCDAVNVEYHYLRCGYTEIDERANNFNLDVDVDALKVCLQVMKREN